MTVILNSKFLSALTYPLFNTSRKLAFFCKKKKKEFPYVITRARNDDHCCIAELLWDHYYPDEPTTQSIGLGFKRNATFDEQALKALAEGLTLVAKCKYTGKIAGAAINKTACPWDPDLTEKFANNVSCPKIRQLYQFYAYMQRAPCLWEKYDTTKIFELSQLFVHKDDRGRGVGGVLALAARKLGADCGYKVVRIDCTSEFTAQICKSQNMYLLMEIPYCSYTGQGPLYEPVFQTRNPHKACKIYIDVPVYDY